MGARGGIDGVDEKEGAFRLSMNNPLLRVGPVQEKEKGFIQLKKEAVLE